MVRVSEYLAVVEKFSLRAQGFCPTQGFATTVDEACQAVRKAVGRQLGQTVTNLLNEVPTVTVLGAEAESAYWALCALLNEYDPGNDYGGTPPAKIAAIALPQTVHYDLTKYLPSIPR